MKKKDKKDPVTKEHTLYMVGGELASEHISETMPVGKEPAYFKVYLEDLGNIMGLSPAENTVFYALCKSMGFNGMVVLIKIVKDMLVKDTGYSYETICAAIKKLSKKGFLIRRARSAYQVNPKYCAKGEWADIKAMRIEIAYSAQGRKVEVKRVPRGNSLQIESSTSNPRLMKPKEEDAQAEEIKDDGTEAEKQRPEMWTDLPDGELESYAQGLIDELHKRNISKLKEQDWTKPNSNAKEIPFKK